MPKYNIIFTSPGGDEYTWDGTSLESLKKNEDESLYFSGRHFKANELPEALKACRLAAKKLFPAAINPEVKAVELKVS